MSFKYNNFNNIHLEDNVSCVSTTVLHCGAVAEAVAAADPLCHHVILAAFRSVNVGKDNVCFSRCQQWILCRIIVSSMNIY